MVTWRCPGGKARENGGAWNWGWVFCYPLNLPCTLLVIASWLTQCYIEWISLSIKISYLGDIFIGFHFILLKFCYRLFNCYISIHKVIFIIITQLIIHEIFSRHEVAIRCEDFSWTIMNTHVYHVLSNNLFEG